MNTIHIPIELMEDELKLINMASIANDSEFMSPAFVRQLIIDAARAHVRRFTDEVREHRQIVERAKGCGPAVFAKLKSPPVNDDTE